MFKTSIPMMSAHVALSFRALTVRDRAGAAGFVGTPTGFLLLDPGSPVS